ncbi:uncharacterized protein [Euwallacea fornicatus]|uniref:uncharacterized protein n=1 Tax=Euwallacea fornicatus TaxID=995702 RepID=UPI00338E9B4D
MDLKSIKNKLKATKCQLTRFKTYVERISLQEIDFNELEARLQDILPIIDRFNHSQSDLELVDSDTSEESHNIGRQEFEDNYYAIIAQAKSLLAKNGSASRANSNHIQHDFGKQISVKLPSISLPTFDGNYEQWLYFKDTFQALIYNEHSISTISKFHYLRLSLKGQAADLLKNLECTADNFNIAWDLLVNRYENKLMLIKNHIKSLFDLGSVQRENLTALRSLVDGAGRHLRALEVLGQPVDSWDSLLIHLIVSKLDHNSKREWECESYKSRTVTFACLIDFLETKCRVLESIHSNTTISNIKPIKCFQQPHDATQTSGGFVNTRHTIEPVEAAQVNTLLANKQGNVLLSTAMVDVLDRFQNVITCRALLDSGSECSFITESLSKQLQLSLEDINLAITGIGQTTSKSLKQGSILMESRHSAFKLKMTCVVLPIIVKRLPTIHIDISHLKLPSHLLLADPAFYEPGPVDILIGADYFWNLLSVGKLQQVPINSLREKRVSCNLVTKEEPLEVLVKRFWEMEEVSSERVLLQADKFCKDLFKNTIRRDESGRFIVTLPFKHDPYVIGRSYEVAEKRLFRLERKFSRSFELKERYSSGLREYESLGHMTKLSSINFDEPHFFLPHHCVIKDSSTTTKLRVVFDASAKDSNGISLNDILHVGPTIQQDLFSILVRMRKHRIMLSGDIAKMYRQVLVNPDQRVMQLILWRDQPSDPLSQDVAKSDPIISRIISHDFYVDDLCTGGESLEEVRMIKARIISILRSAGFELCKFRSIDPDVLEFKSEIAGGNLELGDGQVIKTLGLFWNPDSDIFHYRISPISNEKWTKRKILSIVSRIFDPLGLLAPVIIRSKILIQRLWQSGVVWDESIPLELSSMWMRFKNQLDDINFIKVPRRVIIDAHHDLQIHCFSDASERAYGACIYLRSRDSSDKVQLSLVCAKTRVAPLKGVTMPRLELSAALVAAQLCKIVVKALEIDSIATYFWSDSTIALAWIRSSSSEWKPFVSNRVAEIQDITDLASWGYVNTSDNPADILSRGLSPGELVNNKLWWHGPHWLSSNQSLWPKQRVTAICRRFFNNLKLPKAVRVCGSLTVNELMEALDALTKAVQKSAFQQELRDLRVRYPTDLSCPHKKNLMDLNPVNVVAHLRERH